MSCTGPRQIATASAENVLTTNHPVQRSMLSEITHRLLRKNQSIKTPVLKMWTATTQISDALAEIRQLLRATDDDDGGGWKKEGRHVVGAATHGKHVGCMPS